MKRQFGLLILKKNCSEGATKPQAASAGKLGALESVAADLKMAIYGDSDLSNAGPTSGCRLPENVVLLIAGAPSAEQLESVCDVLDGLDLDFAVVVDALENRAELEETLRNLNEGRFGGTKPRGPVQLLVTGAIRSLVKARRPMLYAFPKCDATTTTAVIVDAGTPEARVLSIVRNKDPYKDCESLPGGFLNVQLESLPECAARELFEECKIEVEPGELVLVDVRSRPSRDERGHVVDHGYAWFVPADRKETVLKAAEAGDDARPGSAKFVLASDLLARSIAFDHTDLLRAALRMVPSRS